MAYRMGMTDQPDTPRSLPPEVEAELKTQQRRAARRVARFRLWVMLATAAIVLGAFVLVLRLRVALPALPAAQQPNAPTEAPASEARPVPRVAPAVENDASLTRTALARVDSVAAAGSERWDRALLLLAASQARDSTQLVEALAKARSAVVLGESTLAAIGELAGELQRLEGRSRGAAPGSSYRLRVAQSAALAYMQELGEDAGFRLEFLRSTVAALEAKADDDDAESEVKTNVANSYQRRSELKQRTLARLRDALAAARQGLDREQQR